MNFLYPAFLIGALAVAIPVVLHLLRRDVAPDVPFSAVRLLRRSPIERTRRRRLRDLLLLAARVGALLLLAAAFARPYLANEAGPSPVRVVAVDRSFSMGAPGRFERARELARAAIDEAGLAERVAVIAFDERADVVAAPGSAADARAALASLTPGFGATRFAPVLEKTLDVTGRGPGRLVLVTDLQRTGWEDEQPALLPAALQVDVKDAGGTADNAAVTSVRVEADRLVASVRNAGGRPFTGRARVVVDGRDAASAPVTIPPASIADVSIAYRAALRGSFAVAIDDGTGYAADNVRYAVLDPQPRARVLIVGAGGGAASGFYLTRAIDAESGDRAFDARVISGAALAAVPAGELSQQSALVLLSTRGLDRGGREKLAGFVRGGGGLLVAAAPDLDPAVLAATLGWSPLAAAEQTKAPVELSATDLRHPIFRPFGPLAANLGQVRFDRVWRVRTDGWDVAARFTDGSAALVERREGSGRVVLFASDLDRRWNDFPLHPAFVPFALESIRYVAGEKDRARDYVVGRVPAGARPEPGVYVTERNPRSVAVNVDTRESATDRLTPEEFAAMLQRVDAPPLRAGDVQAQQTEARQSLWRYGLMLMLAALVAESFVGRA